MIFAKIFLSLVASAALLSGSPGDPTLQAHIEKSDITLRLAGKGLRKKKVAFISVKVYDAFLYVSDPAAFRRDPAEALNSLAEQPAVAIQLRFLRDVDSDRIVASFRDALKANQADIDSAPLKQALENIKVVGEMQEGRTLTFLGLKDAGGETLMLEGGGGSPSSVKGPPGFLKQIYAMWFGRTTESTVEDLKKSLLEKP